MKRFKKMTVCLLVIISLLGMYSQAALACTKSPNCHATGTTSTGVSLHASQDTHTVKYPNGYIASCNITTISGMHSIRCAGCGQELYTAYRTCSVTHSDSHCYDRYNMCE